MSMDGEEQEGVCGSGPGEGRGLLREMRRGEMRREKTDRKRRNFELKFTR